jgi:predicted dehydrogenase
VRPAGGPPSGARSRPAGEISLAVVGLGYWGPNLARNIDSLRGARLAWCCDADAEASARLEHSFRSTRFTSSLDEVLADDSLDGVLLATPVPTHADLAIRVLEAGKHCFVEKPLAQSVADAERVVEAAERNGRVLMVGHLLEYHPGVRKLAEVVHSGELGNVHYIYTNRLNLGQLRADENALWSLGAHDVSVVLSLAGEEPYELDARGECYMRPGIEDVVFAYLRFPSGITAQLHLSWLDPHKERRLTVVGARRMATFDDMELERKLMIYDKGFDEKAGSWGEYITRSGDATSPQISNAEPLRLEIEHFVHCIAADETPRSDGQSGLRVVRVLEGLQQALDRTRR